MPVVHRREQGESPEHDKSCQQEQSELNGAESIAERHTGTSFSLTRPSSISSPGLTADARLIRWPLTCVPFVLPRSSRTQPFPFQTRRACSLDTNVSLNTTAFSAERPS